MDGLVDSDIDSFDDERSLRSHTRRTILLYLFKTGDKVTAYKIAKDTGISYPNVRGALSGLAERFSLILSLICRGMVIEEHTPSGSSVYSLTEKGQSIAREKSKAGNPC
jgi:predicted transcriptional regulator with HTH domain